MVDSQFFYDWEERSYTIEKSVLEKIKNLKGKVEESSYYDDMVKWYLMELMMNYKICGLQCNFYQ